MAVSSEYAVKYLYSMHKINSSIYFIPSFSYAMTVNAAMLGYFMNQSGNGEGGANFCERELRFKERKGLEASPN